MPTRSNKTGQSSAAPTTATSKIKKDGKPSPTAGADPPIIVDGGGSIAVDMPSKFKDKGVLPGGGKKFKNDLGDLSSMEITGAGSCTVDPASGKITVTLKPTSRISISYT
ncbi:MAG: hypothetical protein QOE33_1133 [Acidobacteriota bacterium]|nr:hypothetical protein [Acidobacteriota bacterium]